jgi:hypothetical protein
MNPTQYELATLAATQTGCPADRAKIALALWNACGELLERESAISARAADRESRRAAALADLGGGDTVALELFLKVAMPQSKPEDRARLYRGWVRDNIAFHEGYEGERLESAVERAIARNRKNAYPANIAADLLGNFQDYLTRDRREKNTARAKKGAAAKKALGAKKTAKKRHKQSATRAK